jgi:4'-phosphopantetheinyl transferase
MAGNPSKEHPQPAAEPALRPLPWRLEDPPPRITAPTAEPLLLQVNSRDPLSSGTHEGLMAILSKSEQQRYQAYRLPEDRTRFLRARAGLRLLLAAWLHCPAANVPISTGPHGKPFTPGGPAFNLSHSGEWILLALHPRCPVGVDVEQLHPGLQWQAIAERVLTEPERHTLSQLPTTAQLEGFLAHWCGLEAELKAAGTGFAGLERRRRAAHPRAERAIRRWRLELPPGYRGAVVLIPDAAEARGPGAAAG